MITAVRSLVRGEESADAATRQDAQDILGNLPSCPFSEDSCHDLSDSDLVIAGESLPQPFLPNVHVVDSCDEQVCFDQHSLLSFSHFCRTAAAAVSQYKTYHASVPSSP